MAKISIREPGKNERIVQLSAPLVVVGRQHTCDLVLADAAVSREHCEFRRTPYGYTVIDYGGRNPVRLNHDAVTGETLLRSGDFLRIGKTEITIVNDIDEFAPPPDYRSADAPLAVTADTYINSEAGDTMKGYKPLTPEELAAMFPSPATADTCIQSESGKRINGYIPLTPEELAAYSPPAAPAPVTDDPAPQTQAWSAPQLSSGEIMKKRQRRGRNDLIAKTILFIIFFLLPLAGIVYFFWTQGL